MIRLIFIFSICTLFGSLSAQTMDWTYIPIDSNKQKWGDWAEPQWLRYFGLDAGDVDQDGDKDVLSGRYIYHNPGGTMSEIWKRTVLDDNVDGIFVTNVDDDEFADVIAQALPNIYWYEAVNTSGTQYKKTRIAQVPATSHVNSQGFERADVLPGGKEEFLIAGNGNVYCIAIPEDLKQGELWPTQLIGKNTSDEGIGVGDVDGDGDLDISCGRRAEGENEPTILVWFENPGHMNSSWKDYVVGHTEHPIDRIEIADVNGDGQADIAMAEERYPGLEPDGSLYWFSPESDPKSTWSRQLIVTQYSSNNLDIGDVDADGDIDLLTGEHKGTKLELQLWLNDGQGQFSKQVLDTGKENHLGTQWVDLDADGDLDIIGAAWDNYRWVHVWKNERQDPVFMYEMSYENAPHIVVNTASATYYYDKAGGGFSRIIDREGNDWVSFKREPWGEYPPSAASAFRGLPNLVFQGEDNGAGHPGHQACKSWRIGNQIITESVSGKWKWSWTFEEDHARLDILRTDPDRKYWFLYEGTPGGSYQPDASYFGTNLGGPSKEQYDFYKGDLLKDQFQWMYAGVEGLDRVFYMLQVQSDKEEDILSFLGNTEAGISSKDGMTVWGFGRDAETHPLLSGNQQFIIGFYPKSIQHTNQHSELNTYLTRSYLSNKQ